MKHKTSLLFVAIAFLFFTSYGQNARYVYYFDAHLNICPQSQSVFTGHGIMENNLVKLDVSDNVSKKLALIAHFTDSSLAVSQGLLQSFFTNGIQESQGNYENNIPDGLWEKWDTTGRLVDSINYNHGTKTDSAKYYYFKNGMVNTYNFTDFKNDKLQSIVYNDSGKIVIEALFTGQKGIIKYYTNDKVEIDSLFTRKEKEASFPGGPRSWTEYITHQIQRNLNKLTAKDYGTCIVKFMIDREGNVSNVEATNMQGSALAKIAVNAIKKGPKWIPAVQYGRPVNAYRLQPVTIASPQ